MVGGGSGVSMMAFPVGADAPDLQRFQNSSCMKRDWVLRWWYEEKLAARVLVNEGGTVTAKFKLGASVASRNRGNISPFLEGDLLKRICNQTF